MSGLDPRLTLLFALIFLGLAIFNFYLGGKRMREARVRGETVRWYTQLTVLTGIEYLLLMLAVVVSISISAGWVTREQRSLVSPLYLLLLLLAALLAGVIVFQNTKARRARNRAAALDTATPPSQSVSEEPLQHDPEEQQRRRERRQKAAAARRRRSGRG